MKRISIVFIALLHITAICRGDVCPVGYQPAEYQILEYIESTGTQYIDTGFIPNNNSKLYIKFRDISSTGAWAAGVNAGRGLTDNFGVSKDNIRFGDQYYDQDMLTGAFSVEVDKYGCSINSTKHYWKTEPVISTTKTVYLFWSNGSGASKSGKIYSCKIWNNDTLVRDFIPVRRLADGVIGMYDTVTGTFFTNAGTGTFIAGPETYETIYGNGAVCTVCPPNTYKDTAGDFLCTPCPSTTFSKSGSTSINDCGHVMHVGDKIYFLNSQKLTTPALHVRMPDGTIYYGSLYSEME